MVEALKLPGDSVGNILKIKVKRTLTFCHHLAAVVTVVSVCTV